MGNDEGVGPGGCEGGSRTGHAGPEIEGRNDARDAHGALVSHASDPCRWRQESSDSDKAARRARTAASICSSEARIGGALVSPDRILHGRFDGCVRHRVAHDRRGMHRRLERLAMPGQREDFAQRRLDRARPGHGWLEPVQWTWAQVPERRQTCPAAAAPPLRRVCPLPGAPTSPPTALPAMAQPAVCPLGQPGFRRLVGRLE